MHDRSGHPGGYHNPGWKNAERSGGGRRCLNRLRGHPLDNTVIAIDTRTGAQTVISAEGGTHAVTVDPARHTVVASNTAAGTASVIERRRLFRYADLCRIRHKSAYADRRIMPTAA
ncbi:MAG TPA: hypothetical protein VFP27_08410 [Mycobacterium sp.]|nr:hypothetical protein [Mycobacterium sp.]